MSKDSGTAPISMAHSATLSMCCFNEYAPFLASGRDRHNNKDGHNEINYTPRFNECTTLFEDGHCCRHAYYFDIVHKVFSYCIIYTPSRFRTSISPTIQRFHQKTNYVSIRREIICIECWFLVSIG